MCVSYFILLGIISTPQVWMTLSLRTPSFSYKNMQTYSYLKVRKVKKKTSLIKLLFNILCGVIAFNITPVELPQCFITYYISPIKNKIKTFNLQSADVTLTIHTDVTLTSHQVSPISRSH